MKESGRGGDGGGARRGVRSALVVGEIGLAVMLLVGAALLARSFQRLVQQDPGFRSTHAVTARVELPYSYADFAKIADFYDRLLTTAARAAGRDRRRREQFPAARGGVARAVLRPGPAAPPRRATRRRPSIRPWTTTTSARSACRWSRDASSTPTDNADAPGAVIVNDTLARRQWPNEDPIGQTRDLADQRHRPDGPFADEGAARSRWSAWSPA